MSVRRVLPSVLAHLKGPAEWALEGDSREYAGLAESVVACEVFGLHTGPLLLLSNTPFGASPAKRGPVGKR